MLKKAKKRKSIRKIMPKYMKEEWTNTNPEYIKKMVRKFWKKLYRVNKSLRTEDEKEKREWFKSQKWKEYSEEIKENTRLKEITKRISREEMKNIIKRLKNGKAPGLDKIVNE
jgi:hypothetical protein